MWDDSIPSVLDDSQPFDEPDPAAHVAWTDGQLMRLENEWHRAQRSFAYHPTVGIAPLRGDPPHEYQLDYRVRTMLMDEFGGLQYADAVTMHVWLPPGFPNQPPVVRPLTGVFHPNIAWEGVYLSHPWSPTDTLVDFVARIGELLAYRSYDPESVVNSMAMDWLTQNSGILPLDSRADFSPFAGGEPLGRIQQLGPATLEQIRRALDDMRFALAGEHDAPTAQEVADFARQTRAAVSLFLDSDVPDTLREQAVEFDDWCRELPSSVPWWEYLRRQRGRANASQSTSVFLRNAAAALSVTFKELEGLVSGQVGNNPAAAVKVIPPMNTLQPLQLKLPPLVREFETRVNDLRVLVEGMKELPPTVSIALDGSLGRRLTTQSQSVDEAVATAARSSQKTLDDMTPLLRRSKPELLALEQVAGWREYMDMFAKARGIEKQITEWGSAGIQAFFLSNSSGSFGPFQFEEPLDLGGNRVVVRNLQGSLIEVIDAVGQEVLGRSANGTVTLMLGQADGNPGYPTTFRLTGRCDDLTIQFDFIQKQTAESLADLQRPVTGATSWCGIISAMLSDTHQQQNLREAHRKASHRWKALMSDMAHLLKFKERLATYHLVQRMSEEVPRVKELINSSQTRLNESTQKIQTIMGKSSRDVGTDQLIVPPKFAKLYTDELRARDVAKHEIARLESLLKQIARDLHARLNSPTFCGRPEVPRFRALAPVPDTQAQLQNAMGDEPLAATVAELAGKLRVQLTLNAAPAPAGMTHVTRPTLPDLGPAQASLDFPDEPNAPAPPMAPEEGVPVDSTTEVDAEQEVQVATEQESFVAEPAEKAEQVHDSAHADPTEPEEQMIEDFFTGGLPPFPKK